MFFLSQCPKEEVEATRVAVLSIVALASKFPLASHRPTACDSANTPQEHGGAGGVGTVVAVVTSKMPRPAMVRLLLTVKSKPYVTPHGLHGSPNVPLVAVLVMPPPVGSRIGVWAEQTTVATNIRPIPYKRNFSIFVAPLRPHITISSRLTA